MQRTGVVVSAVAAAAVVGWVGASWYTGMRVEDSARTAAADPKAANDWGVRMELLRYERGVFTSSSRYRVSLAQAGGEPLTATVDNTVHHGPFPRERLARAELKPVFATIESTLAREEGLGSRLQTVEAGATIRASSVVDWHENVRFRITSPAIRVEQDGATLDVDSGTVEGTLAKAAAHLQMEAKLASVRAQVSVPGHATKPLADAPAEAVTIDLRDLSVIADNQVGRFGLRIGDTALRIGSFTVKGSARKAPISITGREFGVAWQAAEAEKFMNGHLSYNVGKLAFNNTEVGDVDLRLVARQLDGAATAKLVTAYRQLIVQTPPAPGADTLRQAMATLQAPLAELLASKPVLGVDSLIWTTPIGQSSLKIDATFTPRDTSAALGRRPGPDLGVEKATIDLSVSQPALVDTIARFTKTAPGGGPITLAQANEQAIMQVNMLLKSVSRENLLTVQGDRIEGRLSYDGKSVLVNGQEPEPHTLRGIMRMLR